MAVSEQHGSDWTLLEERILKLKSPNSQVTPSVPLLADSFDKPFSVSSHKIFKCFQWNLTGGPIDCKMGTLPPSRSSIQITLLHKNTGGKKQKRMYTLLCISEGIYWQHQACYKYAYCLLDEPFERTQSANLLTFMTKADKANIGDNYQDK